MKRISGNRWPALRPGFTLLELLLAVGMTTLLMAAVYGAMSTYWNLALDSKEEITRSQVARTIMHRLARDIRSVTFAEQVTQNSGTSTEGTANSETGTTTAPVATSTYGNGLIGTDRDLMLYISYPDKNLAYVPLPDTLASAARNSDLMIVRWLLADRSGIGVASALAGMSETDSSGIAGLARGAGGINSFGRAIETDNIDQQLEATFLVASEVQDVVFEYFDGIEWQAEWNSSGLNKMPHAVHIELTLREPPEDGRTPGVLDMPVSIHRLVVPIPVARPFVQETAL